MPRTPPPSPPPPRARPPRKGRGRGRVLTSDVIYSDAEQEFLAAMAAFQKRTGVKFPTWSQALGVLLELGYRKPEGGG